MTTRESIVKCFVCDDKPRYQCPRCGVHYCSLGCYKDQKHQECSEGFYKEQVMDELKNMKGSSEDKRKMIQLLQQQQKESSRDQDLEQRLAGIHLDDHEGLWENLTDHEKYIFEERLRTGNVDFLKLWQPWWENSRRKSKFPSLFKDMESCEDLLKGKLPNSSVKYNIVEVLFTYVCLMRLFNGDLYDSPIEVADCLCNLSNVLSEDRRYCDIETVVIVMQQNFCEKIRFSGSLLDDCVHDMKYFADEKNSIITHALCDFHNKVKKLRKILKGNEIQSKLYKMVKKLYFHAIYTNENEAAIKKLCTDFLEVFMKKTEENYRFKELTQDIEKFKPKLQPKSENLIEEI